MLDASFSLLLELALASLASAFRFGNIGDKSANAPQECGAIQVTLALERTTGDG